MVRTVMEAAAALRAAAGAAVGSEAPDVSGGEAERLAVAAAVDDALPGDVLPDPVGAVVDEALQRPESFVRRDCPDRTVTW